MGGPMLLDYQNFANTEGQKLKWGEDSPVNSISFLTISVKRIDGGDSCDEVTGEEGRDFGQVLEGLADLGEQDTVVLHQTVD